MATHWIALSRIKTACVVLIFSIVFSVPALANAHSSKSEKNQKFLRSVHLHKHYNKKYDGSFAKKWADYLSYWKNNHPQSSPQAPNGYCPVSFQKKVTAVKIRGHHIYLNLNDLEFLRSAGFVLQEAELDLVLKGRHQQEENISLSLNGFKVNKPGQLKINELVNYLKSQDISKTQFKLHQLFINGAEPFEKYLAKVKRNKGLLKISLYGRHYQIISAEITFKGFIFKSCNNPGPNPNPNPTPEDLNKYAVRIDSVNPAQATTASTNMMISFSSVNTDGTYWCSLDQAAFEKCQSPISYVALASGNHNFQVFATTPKGVDGAKASYSWRVDNVKPVVTITNAAEIPTLTNETSIKFEFTSTKPGGTFRCSLDGATPSSCQSPISYNVISEGTHRFSVTAVDSLGNVSGASAIFQWVLDLTAPVANFISVLPAQDYLSSQTKDFAFGASETSDFECSFDGGNYSDCLSPLNLTELSEGPHSLLVRPIDLAGNEGSEISYSWTTDYTSPQISFIRLIPIAGVTNSKNISAEFDANEPSSFYCQFDSEAASLCSSLFERNNLSEGVHRLTVYAIDRAGLRSANIVSQWRVDFTAPLISFGQILPSSASFINSANLSVAINASEDTSLSASLNGIPVASANPLVLSNLGEGPYNLLVSGLDSAGNASNILQYSFTVDLTAPILNVEYEGGQISMLDYRNFTFSANEDVSFECSLDDGGFQACQTEVAYSGLAEGEHNFTIRAVDRAGNATTNSFSWFQDTTLPPIKTLITGGVPPGMIVNVNQMTIAFTADQPAQGFVCSLDGAPFTSCVSAITYTNLSNGSHTATIKAIDQYGNIDPIGATKTWIVDTQAPVVSNFSTTSTSTSITVNWTTNEPATGRVNYGVGSALNQNTAEITLLESNHSIQLIGLSPNTTYSIRMIGKDGAGNTYISAVFTARTN